VFGLADLREADWERKLLLIGPHLCGVLLVTCFGPRQTWAGVVALAGSAVMTSLSWWDALDRQTDGFEWQFNNALSGMICCGANWLVLAVVACVASVVAAANQEADAESSAGER
jgi:hypothetical protein